MIDIEVDLASLESRNFGVKLRVDGGSYFVPTDGGTKAVLLEVLHATIAQFQSMEADWEPFDISEDYGVPRPVYVRRDAEYFGILSDIYDAGTLSDLSNLNDHVRMIEYYFCEYYDAKGAKIIGLKKAVQFKTMLGARNKLARLVNDTLQIIEEDVVKIDPVFDVLITPDHIFILNSRAVEQVANISPQVAAAAASKVRQIHDSILFLDLSRIEEKIGAHPQMARIAASVAARDDLGSFQQDRIEALANQHGIVFKKIGNRLQCRVSDEAKLLEVLDARRYHLDLANTGGSPYRASARQKVSP